MDEHTAEEDAVEPVPLARLQESNPARWGKPGTTWRCEAHGVITSSDCPVCDELIALHEESSVTEPGDDR